MLPPNSRTGSSCRRRALRCAQSGDLPPQGSHVLEQALAGEAQEIEAELRVFEAELTQLIVGDRQHAAGLEGLQCLGASVARRQEPISPTTLPGGTSRSDSRRR